MLYRTMPKIKEKLSVLGFGCMRLPVNKDYTIDEPRAIKQIRYAIDHGVNYFDTAWPYHGGQSEPLLGKALCEGYREKVNIATKLPSWMIRDEDHMVNILDQQLAFLQTGQIDFYLVHNLAGPMWKRMKESGVIDFLDKAKADGKVKYAGFSFHGQINDFKTIVDDYPWEFCQIQYNYLDEKYQAGTEGLKYAAAKNLGVIIMEPLRGGSLALPDPPPGVADIWNQANHKRTPVEWALRWIMDHPEVTTVLSGMNEEAHIEENIRIAGEAKPESLSEKELSLVRDAAETYKKLLKVNCTGCEYCLPCPEDVNIPGAFEALNKLHLYKDETDSKFAYAIRCSGILHGSDHPEYASNCVECGECLDKCPQEIDIPDMLKIASEELEDEHLEKRVAQAKKMLNME